MGVIYAGVYMYICSLRLKLEDWLEERVGGACGLEGIVTWDSCVFFLYGLRCELGCVCEREKEEKKENKRENRKEGQ